MSHTTLLLLRHGQTDSNSVRRMQGHADVPLNDTGRAQARAVSDIMRDYRIDACYSSDLSRAVETAQIVAEPHGLRPTQDARLREMNLGSWTGRLFNDVAAEFPSFTHDYLAGVDFHRSKTGESVESMLERSIPAFEEIIAAHQGQCVLVVAHGLLLLQSLQRLLGFTSIRPILGRFANAHFSELGDQQGRRWVARHNVGPH